MTHHIPRRGSYDLLGHWAASLSLLCALFGACYQISTRKLAGIDRAVTTQFYSALVGAAAITSLMPFVWQTPDLQGALMMLCLGAFGGFGHWRSEEHTSELQSLMRISYAVFCLKKKKKNKK